MAIFYDGFFLDRRLSLWGTRAYYPPQWSLFLPESILLEHRFEMSDETGQHRLEWQPIVIIPPVFTNDAFFLDRRFYKSDGDIHRLEYIPIVIPIPVFYDGVMLYHWVDPVRSTPGDDAYFLIRNIPPPVLDFGASCHKCFVNRRVSFFNNSDGDEFEWSFGDGSGSTKRTPKHTYRKAGVYTIRLSIDGVWYTDDILMVVLENSFVMDAGAVYLNYGEKNARRLGATEGGNLFGIRNEYRHMTFDGSKGEIIQSHRVIGSTPVIIANMIEIDYRLLNSLLPGSDVTFRSGSALITRAIKRLVESDHIKNIAIVSQHGGTGSFIIFKISNAITLESLEIPFEDSRESVIECTFTGCFTPENTDSEPWEIEFIQ